MLKDKEKKVAIYTRVSTQYQVDKASLPVQRQELINYSKYALGIADYDIFEDAGYSAKNTDRPDYQRMIARVRTGEFTHVLVWKIDRISRNLLDFASMYSELKSLGVTFVSKNEQFDTSSAIGEAMLKIILVFAELERNMTSERVSAIMLSRANSGTWNGGRVPYGYAYHKETKSFTVIDDEAKIVEHIYSLYEARKSLTVVAKEINATGSKTTAGFAWTAWTVRNVLTSPFYAGTYRYNYRDESNVVFRPEDEWILVRNHHPAIVTEERQEKIKAILQGLQRGKRKTYTRKNTHVFAGLLTCGKCGSTMVATIDRARSNGWRPSIYSCSRRRRYSDCDNKYISDVALGPFTINFIANLIKAAKSFGRSTTIETLQKKLLRGEAFAAVDHIEGLEELYNHFRRGYDTEIYESSQISAAETQVNVKAKEKSVLMSEYRRQERALEKIKNLFLYGDAMSEADYITERNKIKGEMDRLEKEIKELSTSGNLSATLSDEEFMEKASYFILSQQLQDKRYINYENFIQHVNVAVVKEFLQSIVSNFCIADGLTTSICFKNGIELKFIYKS